MSGVPLQHDCDPTKPEEHLLWTYVQLPLGKTAGVAPLITHPEVLKEWSKRQYQAGMRHHPELQTHKYVPPAMGHSAFGAPGVWEPIGKAEELLAQRETAAAGEVDRLKSELLAAMPDLAGKLDGLTEQEKAAARADMSTALRAQMRQMQDLLTQIESEGD